MDVQSRREIGSRWFFNPCRDPCVALIAVPIPPISTLHTTTNVATQEEVESTGQFDGDGKRFAALTRRAPARDRGLVNGDRGILKAMGATRLSTHDLEVSLCDQIGVDWFLSPCRDSCVALIAVRIPPISRLHAAMDTAVEENVESTGQLRPAQGCRK